MFRPGSHLGDLQRARVRVDSLLAHVQPDSLYERPIPLRHRIVFYIGHVEAFDLNLFRERIPGLAHICPDLERLFAFGIDPAAGSEQNDQASDWPELDAVYDFRDRVRERTDAVWADIPEQLRHVALEHRLMHAETLAYILHALEPSRLIPPADLEFPGEPQQNGRQMQHVSAGVVTLGQNRKGAFGWDNEFPPMRASVDSFHIDRYKVTNGDYLRFVQAGGPAPHFWRRHQDGWHLRRMFDEVPLPLDWPVYVTWRQAAAYAEWRGAALPSEAEWHRAAYGDPATDDEREYPWGHVAPEQVRGNFDFRRWDPAPVHCYPGTASAFGVEDLLGNGWEWTSSPFRPFDGFEAFSFYPGYSAPFFDDDHFVLKGGSPRTSSVFLRRSFRNWFRSDYPWVFSTFRCIQH